MRGLIDDVKEISCNDARCNHFAEDMVAVISAEQVAAEAGHLQNPSWDACNKKLPAE
jgi:hypothetical protein